MRLGGVLHCSGRPWRPLRPGVIKTPCFLDLPCRPSATCLPAMKFSPLPNPCFSGFRNPGSRPLPAGSHPWACLLGDSHLLPATRHEMERTRPEKHHESNNRSPEGQEDFFPFRRGRPHPAKPPTVRFFALRNRGDEPVTDPSPTYRKTRRETEAGLRPGPRRRA